MARAAFQQQFGFFRLTFEQQIELAADQRFLFLLADLALDDIRCLRRRSISRGESFFSRAKACSAVLIGVGEGAHPVELGFAHEVAEFFEFFFGFAGEADDERSAQSQVWDCAAHFGDRSQEDIRAAAALHALEYRSRGVLQGHVHVRADLLVLRDRVRAACR